MSAYGLWWNVCGFQISHGGVCMSYRVVRSNDDLLVHYLLPLGWVLFKIRAGWEAAYCLLRLTVSLLPSDQSFLFSEHYGLLMPLLCAHPPNAKLFLEN